MGCDISIFIELDRSNNNEPFSGETVPLGNGEILSIDRNYYLFAALADVRNDGSIRNLIPPRGIPINLSWELIPHFYQPIKEELKSIPSNFWYSWNEIGIVTRKEANNLVDKNLVKYNQEIPNLIKQGQLVTQLDAHTFGWLLLEEIKLSIETNNLEIKDENFLIIIDLMEMIEKRIGEKRTRMLFYFNN
jgi:hypothetical protein